MFPLLHGRRWWHFRRFEGLLLSLACMFLLNIIFPGKIYGGTAQACYLPLQLLAGINLYGRLRPGFWAAALTAAGILALHPFQALSSMPRALQFSLLLLHGLFFFIILLEVFIQLYRADLNNFKWEMLYGMPFARAFPACCSSATAAFSSSCCWRTSSPVPSGAPIPAA